MSKNITKHKEASKTVSRKPKEKETVFDRLNNFFDTRSRFFLLLILLSVAIVSVLLFDLKVSIGGDDSGYILKAYDFSHDFIYPTFQGPLYPVFLSLFISLFGIKLLLLKSLSLGCMLVFFWLFYSQYKNRIASSVLFFTLLILSVNSHILYYSSQTYSEAFFMMMQGVLFFITMKYFISDGAEKINLRTDYKKFLLLGCMLSLVALTKNMGFASVLAVLAYFMITKRWKSSLLAFLSTMLFMLLIEGVKRIFFHDHAVQINEQGLLILNKDYYNPTQGYETFSGFIRRFINNAYQYISKDIFIISGLRSTPTVIPFLTILTSLFFFVLLFLTRRNKYLFFTGIYLLVMFLSTFLLLQSQLGQERLIMVYFPWLLIFFLGSIYQLFTLKKKNNFRIGFVAASLILFFCSLRDTLPAINAQKKILKKNLAGNMLYGYDEAWRNYIEMSKWAAANIAPDKIIASRKPEISFIYTERKFFGIYQAPSISTDSLLTILRQDTGTVSVTVPAYYFSGKINLDSLYNECRKYIRAVYTYQSIIDDQKPANVNIVYSFPKNSSPQWLKTLSDNQVPFRHDIGESISDYTSRGYSFLTYIPETLINMLKAGDVRYLILSPITFNGVNVSTTVHRLVESIRLKYSIFRLVHSIGNDEEKGSRLIEVEYERMKPTP